MNLNKINDYFLIYADCKVVSGVKEFIIQDLARKEIYKFPQSYYEIINLYKKHKFKDIYNYLDKEDYKNFEDFTTYLIENDLGEFVDDINCFPELPEVWDSPNLITNAIIDVDENSDYSISETILKLSNMSCKHLQIRFFSKVDFNVIENIVLTVKELYFDSLEIIMRYENDKINSKAYQLIEKFYVLDKIVFYSADKDEVIKQKRHNETYGLIIKVFQQINSNNSCGIINYENFNISGIKDFFESKIFNSCLNKKISIDVDGEIKNCPSMKFGFGNINKNDILNIVSNNDDFKKYWNISKDQVSVCKSCEFRYVCTDCRAFLENPDDLYSKPLKCGYNPYENVWEEWSTNPLKQKAIKYYGIQDLIKKDA